MPKPHINWPVVLRRAAEIVRSYDTGVTLRQLYYRLVSEQLIPNKQTAYNALSSRTAQARRDGWFPELVDRGRDIHGGGGGFKSPSDALRHIADMYMIDRTIGQKVNVFIGVEKNGLLNLLINWFADYGVSVIALGGYSSQTFCDEVKRAVIRDGRPAVLIYGGDFDPSGIDILRDFKDRTACWARTHRIALNPSQIAQFNLPPLPGKATDSRAGKFIEEHGRLMQVELDALPPDVLRALYTRAFMHYWNPPAYTACIEREDKERQTLVKLAKAFAAKERKEKQK